jgi:hypothetical protein
VWTAAIPLAKDRLGSVQRRQHPVKGDVRGVAVATVDESRPSLVDDVGVVVEPLIQVIRGQPDRR